MRCAPEACPIEPGPRRRLGGRLGGSASLAAGLLISVHAGGAEEVRFESTLLGQELRIEVTPRPGVETEVALQAAAAEAIDTAELLRLDGSTSALDELNGGPEGELRAIDPRLHRLLLRALTVCRWSANAHGPIGGNLYALWGLRRSVGGLPSTEALQREVTNAECSGLLIEAEEPRAALRRGQLDLWGFAEGFVVDETVAKLIAAGFRSGWVELGRVTRAFGAGPEGKGWPIVASAGSEETTTRIWLRDQAVAVASAADRKIEIGGEVFAPFLNQRSGRPVSGTAGVVVVTDLALDAQALAVALFVMPNRIGEFRLGMLRPRPAVVWYLGSGSGEPLLNFYRWAELPKW